MRVEVIAEDSRALSWVYVVPKQRASSPIVDLNIEETIGDGDRNHSPCHQRGVIHCNHCSLLLEEVFHGALP